MTFRCCASKLAFSRIQVVWVRILTRHILAQPGVRKVEASAPWAVGSATRAWNFCGVYNSGVARNVNWGASPPLLTGVRGYNPGKKILKLKVLVGKL